MKNQKSDKRILNRMLAKEISAEELKNVSGGLSIGSTTQSHTFAGGDDDDCDDREI
jgi:bacteriocin-like protein